MRKLFIFLSAVFFVTSLHAEFNPLHQATTNIGTAPFFLPRAEKSIGGAGTTYSTAWALEVEVEIPIYSFLNSGFVWDVTFGFPGFTILMDLDVLIKPQWPIALPKGYIAPYLSAPVGISVLIGNEPLLEYQPETGDLAGGLKKANGDGVGPNAALLAGLEYHPIPEIGLFVEGGYRGAWLGHHILQAERTTLQFHTYFLHGFTMGFGLRINL